MKKGLIAIWVWNLLSISGVWYAYSGGGEDGLLPMCYGMLGFGFLVMLIMAFKSKNKQGKVLSALSALLTIGLTVFSVYWHLPTVTMTRNLKEVAKPYGVSVNNASYTKYPDDNEFIDDWHYMLTAECEGFEKLSNEEMVAFFEDVADDVRNNHILRVENIQLLSNGHTYTAKNVWPHVSIPSYFAFCDDEAVDPEGLEEYLEMMEEISMGVLAEKGSSSNNSGGKCYWCNGTGSVRYNYGSSDLEAILSGHDPYTYGQCGSCGGTGIAK